MKMSEMSTKTPRESTSCAEGSRVKTSASPELAPESTASEADSGPSMSGAFVFYDRESSSWRTCQASLLGLDTFSGRWPRSGTMRRGVCSGRAVLEPHTGASACSSWLPTPTAASYGRNKSPSAGAAERLSLQSMASRGRFPTPTVSGNNNRPKQGTKRGYGLAAFVREMVPTPLASDAGRGFSNNPRRNGRGPRLCEVTRGPLNPTWVEWLMGFPVGWTASEP